MISSSSSVAYQIMEIPYSSYDTWFGISPVVGQHAQASDLHLVSHQNGMHPVLRCTPIGPETGDRVRTVWQATPARLTWQADGRRVDLAYESADTVRLRGRGLGM